MTPTSSSAESRAALEDGLGLPAVALARLWFIGQPLGLGAGTVPELLSESSGSKGGTPSLLSVGKSPPSAGAAGATVNFLAPFLPAVFFVPGMMVAKKGERARAIVVLLTATERA